MINENHIFIGKKLLNLLPGGIGKTQCPKSKCAEKKKAMEKSENPCFKFLKPSQHL